MEASYQGDGNFVENGFAALVDELGRAGKADGGDLLSSAIFGSSRNDLGLDGERTTGEVSAQAMQVVEVLRVDGKLVDLNVVGDILGMRPPDDGIGSRMQDVLGVGAGKVGREGDVEGVGDGGVGSLRVGEGRASLRRILGMSVDGITRHIGTATHAEVGAHPLGPVPHICQLIHGRSLRRGLDGASSRRGAGDAATAGVRWGLLARRNGGR